MEAAPGTFDLQVRYQIYRLFAETGQAPAYQAIASLLHVAPEAVRRSFHLLNDRHMIFLQPGTDHILMANPFSATPTPFRVRRAGQVWWANCAWDAFGVAAALHADVEITAHYPDSADPIPFHVSSAAVDGRGHVVYFPLPCRQWYDDLVFT